MSSPCARQPPTIPHQPSAISHADSYISTFRGLPRHDDPALYRGLLSWFVRNCIDAFPTGTLCETAAGDGPSSRDVVSHELKNLPEGFTRLAYIESLDMPLDRVAAVQTYLERLQSVAEPEPKVELVLWLFEDHCRALYSTGVYDLVTCDAYTVASHLSRLGSGGSKSPLLTIAALASVDRGERTLGVHKKVFHWFTLAELLTIACTLGDRVAVTIQSRRGPLLLREPPSDLLGPNNAVWRAPSNLVDAICTLLAIERPPAFQQPAIPRLPASSGSSTLRPILPPHVFAPARYTTSSTLDLMPGVRPSTPLVSASNSPSSASPWSPTPRSRFVAPFPMPHPHPLVRAPLAGPSSEPNATTKTAAKKRASPSAPPAGPATSPNRVEKWMQSSSKEPNAKKPHPGPQSGPQKVANSTQEAPVPQHADDVHTETSTEASLSQFQGLTTNARDQADSPGLTEPTPQRSPVLESGTPRIHFDVDFHTGTQSRYVSTPSTPSRTEPYEFQMFSLSSWGADQALGPPADTTPLNTGVLLSRPGHPGSQEHGSHEGRSDNPLSS
jgi:hypothetical protein